uniref:Nuclear receptor domain-containing protein n=1 Tax=Ditylenchus dipsaci TaxID=166011 RepID=A0A915CVA8_9BILA
MPEKLESTTLASPNPALFMSVAIRHNTTQQKAIAGTAHPTNQNSQQSIAMDQQQQQSLPSSVADLQQLSAMIAVIAANSPPSLPVSTTSIPSPQSAFAFLRPTESNSFATPPIANGLLSVSSEYHQNPPHLGAFDAVTQSSDQLASAGYNPYGCSFPATPVPPPQNTFLVEHFSKMLASTVDPCAILAKLQQQLAMADGSGGSGQRLLPHLPPQPSPSSSTASFLMEENSRRHSFGDRTMGMEQKYLAASPFKKEQDDLPLSLPNPSRKMSMGAHEYSSSGSAPPRKIRRRRPKSPTMNKPMICVKSEVEEPCLEMPMKQQQQEEQRLMEQPAGTPDDPTDPVMHSPPSSNLNLMGMSNSNAFHPVRQQHQHSKDYGCQEPRSRPPPSSSLGKDVLDSQGDPKKCLVCADRATGYNFNVITCESCKAFFRRNALRPKNGKDFKCPYTDQCEITTVSRRFCQKCRLKKCFDVGMKKSGS